MGCMGPSVVVRPTNVGVLVGMAGPGLVGCQALTHAVAASSLVDGVKA